MLLAFGNVVIRMISQRDSGDFARFYTVTDPTKHRKGYTVYKVTARIISRNNPEDVQEITVWKRYSDFRKLHHNLWQLHKNVCSQSELFPPFAKAKVFGRFDEAVIEERRQRLEDLLQFSANIPALYSSQHIQEFFKGGEVHDGSELIGPLSEPFCEFLTDGLSGRSSDVERDLGCGEDLTITSEYGGPSSDSSDLNSLAVDTDSLAELDDGMASGRTSPNHPHGGAASVGSSSSSSSPRLPSLHDRRGAPSPAPAPGSPAPKPEVSRPGRASLFSKKAAGLKEKLKADYLDKAGEIIRVAVQKEKDQDYQAAFAFYRSGVDLLLQGVQGEPSPTRREAVKKKTAEYLMRAEQISSQHLHSNMGQGSTQTAQVMGAQCCASTNRGSQQSLSDDLGAYRVVGVIDKVLLVTDKRTREMFVVKGLRKSSDCGRLKKTITPRSVPHMVQLKKLIDSEDTVFLLLQHAEGGKLWSHIGKYLRNSSPDESFDIPFIQKSHTLAVHTPQYGVNSASSNCGPVAGWDSVPHVNKEVKDPAAASSRKSGLLARLGKKAAAHSDSGATSEEECTNSYLTLCNEYEREKVEPDALEEDNEARSEQEASFDVPNGAAAAASRSRSLLSNDSLASPVSCQELGFFADSPDKRRDGEGRDYGDVLHAPLSLDQSKRTPMEFFRIDSKDSASEVTCLDWREQQQQPQPPSHKQPPLFSASEVVEEFQELAPEVEGHSAHLWGLDYCDKGSNESVPVISFKEAVVEDEGHPPDLLVNLPVTSVAADSQQAELETSMLCLGLEVATSPQRSIKPDVLQLPGQLGGEEGRQPSSLCAASANRDPGVASSSVLTSLWDDYSLTFGQEDKEKMSVEPPCHHSDSLLSPGHPVASSLCEKAIHTDAIANVEPQAREKSLAFDAESAAVSPDRVKFDKDVSRLFAELDEMSLAASRARIPEAFVRCWAVELVTALDSLHREGIICRDLNPNNILLDRQGHVHLTYFCSWSDVEESCDEEASANMYCAPEVGGIGEETAACDWWSLGAILFELLTSTIVCVCVCVCVFCCCLCERGASWLPPLALVLRECQGCPCDFLPQLELHLPGHGVRPPRASFLAPGAPPGSRSSGSSLTSASKSLLQCHPAGIGRHTALNIPESLSEEARSLLEQLLQYNPAERLGAGVAGVDDIKSHPFFAKVDWTK
ncbi:ribosomal protein S6 kinase delta-1 isoform X3 [Phyllopteryx taeniolatus]|uniref:ribosomal protein S6 kinase delta-1 isoform X3 n=1 Tax=Phyllopteryx taeniolatus TaxID=161469 RepID=UPI002AD57267|nr:ribosomal protein S6 kinase delta-1 isoform X3 [Phyllopteryx taeniolatus]